MSIRDRVLKVGAAELGETSVIMAVRLLSVPLFLHFWSTELYGEWLILYSLLSYFSIGNQGFAQAAANEMTISVSAGDRPQALVTFQSTLWILVVAALVVMGAAGGVAWLLPVGRLMHVSHIAGPDLRAIVLLLAAYVMAGLQAGLAMAAYRCEGLYHRGLVLAALELLVEFLGTAVALRQGYGPLAVAWVMVASRWAVVVVMTLDFRVRVPWLKAGWRHARWDEFKRLLGPSLSFAAYPVGSTVMDQGVVVGIGVLISPVAVVIFSSLRTLTNLATRLFELVNQAFYPEISMAWGRGDRELVARLHRISCQASLWLGLGSVGGLALFGPWLFRVWTHGKVPMSLPLFWGFLALVLARSLWYTSFVVPAAINRHQKLTIFYLLISTAGLAVALVMLKISLPWVLVGFAMVEASMILVVTITSLRISASSLRVFLAAVLAPPSPGRLVRALARR